MAARAGGTASPGGDILDRLGAALERRPERESLTPGALAAKKGAAAALGAAGGEPAASPPPGIHGLQQLSPSPSPGPAVVAPFNLGPGEGWGATPREHGGGGPAAHGKQEVAQDLLAQFDRHASVDHTPDRSASGSPLKPARKSIHAMRAEEAWSQQAGESRSGETSKSIHAVRAEEAWRSTPRDTSSPQAGESLSPGALALQLQSTPPVGAASEWRAPLDPPGHPGPAAGADESPARPPRRRDYAPASTTPRASPPPPLIVDEIPLVQTQTHEVDELTMETLVMAENQAVQHVVVAGCGRQYLACLVTLKVWHPLLRATTHARARARACDPSPPCICIRAPGCAHPGTHVKRAPCPVRAYLCADFGRGQVERDTHSRLAPDALHFAQANGSEVRTVDEAKTCTAFHRAMLKGFTVCNKMVWETSKRTNALQKPDQLRRYTILPEQFTPVDETLRPDGSVDRTRVLELYADVVESMYGAATTGTAEPVSVTPLHPSIVGIDRSTSDVADTFRYLDVQQGHAALPPDGQQVPQPVDYPGNGMYNESESTQSTQDAQAAASQHQVGSEACMTPTTPHANIYNSQLLSPARSLPKIEPQSAPFVLATEPKPNAAARLWSYLKTFCPCLGPHSQALDDDILNPGHTIVKRAEPGRRSKTAKKGTSKEKEPGPGPPAKYHAGVSGDEVD